MRAALDLPDERGQLGGPERGGALPGRVDVIGQRDARRVARDELDLAGGQRRAQAADDVLEAMLVRHQRVRVALDEDRPARFAHGRLGPVDEVQRAALVEQRRRRRVEVLGPRSRSVDSGVDGSGRGCGRRGRSRCPTRRGWGT